MDKRPALGRGLSALIPAGPASTDTTSEVDIDRLAPNVFQPRAEVQEGHLEDLARSIKSNGLIQPIVVRRTDGERYQIIAGERRWRAARLAGLRQVPVVVREIPEGHERSLLEMALIENIQRENLNPIDEAAAYQRLSDEFHLTQDAIAGAVGKDRASIANYLRLLKLPGEVRAEVAAGALSMGHARAIIGLTDEGEQRRVAREVIERGLSVRETESMVRRLAHAKKPTASRRASQADVHTRAAEEQLRLILGTRVRIVRRGKRGRIEIDFASEDELIRIYEQLADRRSSTH